MAKEEEIVEEEVVVEEEAPPGKVCLRLGTRTIIPCQQSMTQPL